MHFRAVTKGFSHGSSKIVRPLLVFVVVVFWGGIDQFIPALVTLVYFLLKS